MGIPEGKIEGLTICNSRFVCTGGESEELADKKVEELETLYPESTMFGILPAYGMYVRHARNIQLYGLSFELLKEDGSRGNEKGCRGLLSKTRQRGQTFRSHQ